MSKYSLFPDGQIPTKEALIALGRHRLYGLLVKAQTWIGNLPYPYSNYEHYQPGEHEREEIIDSLIKEIGPITEVYRELDDKEAEANRIWVEQQLGVEIPKNWSEIEENRVTLRLLCGEALHEVSQFFRVPISTLKQQRSEFLERIAKFNHLANITILEAALKINDEDYLGVWEWYKSDLQYQRARRELIFRRERLSDGKIDYIVAYSAAPDEGRHLVTQELERFNNYENASVFCLQLAEKYAPHHICAAVRDSLATK